MAVAKQFQQLGKITNGTTAETDVKLSDPLALQHIDITSGANSLNQISLAQSMCQPVAVTPNSTPSGGAYTATCSNYPDFSLTYTDKNGNIHYLVGMKVRVIFTKGITYGSVSGGTYPTLNINSSGAIPLLAQGKTMAAGAAVDGQSLELTLIPYGNGVAWDADSNVRESTSDYTIYTDGSKVLLQEYNCIRTIKVNSQKSKTISFGNWGYILCVGNIDGAGNFAFFLAKSGNNNLFINNLNLGNSFNQATLNNNVVEIGNTGYKITITFNSGEIVFAWAGTATGASYYGKCAFIGGDSSL